MHEDDEVHVKDLAKACSELLKLVAPERLLEAKERLEEAIHSAEALGYHDEWVDLAEMERDGLL